jgi:hypothetical protein
MVSKKIKSHFLNQSGQVAIVVGIMMVAIVGALAYVIDTGSIYESRRTYQTVADSAALSGAQELPDAADAGQAAIDYAEMQGVSSEFVTVEVKDTFVSNDTIRVTAADMDRPTFFAGIFGVNSTAVGADATAMVGSPDGYSNIVPFGVLEEDWVPGSEYTLKWGPQEDGHIHGNFGPLALGGTGAQNYETNIREGYKGTIRIGNVVETLRETEPGNMMGPTVRGTEDRIYNYPDNTFNSFSELTIFEDGVYKLTDNTDSQYVICPLIDWVPFGRKEVTILAFVPFIITSVSGSEVRGTFIDEALIITEGGITALDEHGIRVIRLIQ